MYKSSKKGREIDVAVGYVQDILPIELKAIKTEHKTAIDSISGDISSLNTNKAGKSEVLLKSVYDTDGDGVVDKAVDSEYLGGKAASMYPTKEEMNSKLSSVYKYKGTKDYYFELPTNNEVGDVYNIKYASGNDYDAEYPKYSYDIRESNVSGYYAVYLTPMGTHNQEHLKQVDKIQVFFANSDGIQYSYTLSDYSNNTLDIDDSIIFFMANDSDFDATLIPENGYAYIFQDLQDIAPRTPFIVNDGDNVAWTGEEWDILGGSVDMSTYAQKDLSNVENETFKAKAEEAGVSGGGSTEIFIVNATDAVPFPGEPGYVELDKTYDEIVEAYNANKIVYAKGNFGGVIYIPLVIVYEGSYIAFQHYNGMHLRDIIWRKGEDEPVYYEEEYMINEFVEDINVFVIHATLTSETTATTEESYDEIKEAITAEKQILIAVGRDLFTVIKCKYDSRDSFITAAYENEYSIYDATITSDGTVTFRTTEKVLSVNGRRGEVNLTASDVGAYTKDETNSNISGAVDTNIGILRVDILQKLSEELPKKADKTTLFTWDTAGIENFVLDNNQEAMFFADMAVMVLAMPETINDLYHSNFSFSSGEEPTTLTYSATPIIWVGDDCDADGIFVPEANTRYEVSVKKLGDDIVARVGAY